ncbi:MAG TPA: ArsA-related P-loop ATPase, partial [Actinomycetota bacterium]|nr:ArsA-related P-loop ATPase [Actinomycetota bacterium]
KITRLREEMREQEEFVARVRREEEVEEDQILGELHDIRDRIRTASGILTDREKTAFFFVVTPEEMIIVDTRRAAELFAKFDVPIGGYVVNRVLPEELLTEEVPGYLKNRIEMQRRYLKKIRETFGEDILAQIPEMERDVSGLPMIERVAERMYGG